MRRAVRIGVVATVLLGVAVLTVLLAAVALHWGWQREPLRAALETRLSEALGERVSVGRIAGPLLPRLDLRELRVGPPDDPQLVVERLTLGVSWRRSLRSRGLVLRRLAVQGARLSLRRDDAGRWRLPAWLASGETGEPPPPLQVDRTTFTDATLHVAWSEGGAPAAVSLSGAGELSVWRLPASPDQRVRGRLRARAHGEGSATRWLEQARLEAGFDGGRVALEALEILGGQTPPLRLAEPAMLTWSDDRLRVEGLALESEAQALRLDGALSREGFQQLHADLRNLDVTLAGRLLGGAAQPGGRVSGTVELDGPYLRPRGRVDLTWSQPTLGSAVDAWGAERASLRASGDGREIRLEALAVEGLPGGTLRLAGPARLRIGDDAVELVGIELRSAKQALVANGRVSRQAFRGLALELRNLDVDWLGRVLGLSSRPGGSMDGQVALDGPFERPTGTVSLRWRDPRWLDWTGQELALHGEVDRDRQLAELEATLRLAEGTLRARASLPPRDLARALEADSPTRARGVLPDALRAELHTPALATGAFAALLPALTERVQGRLAADLVLHGGERPTLAGSLVLSDATLSLPGPDRIEGARAELRLTPRPGALGIERLHVAAPGFELEGDGSVALDGLAELELTLAAPDLEMLSQAHGLGAPLAGTLEANASVQGRWPRPSFEGLVVWSQPAPDALTPHRAQMTIASDERDLVGRLSIHQGGRVAARGELLLPYGDAGLPAMGDAPRHARLDLHAEDFDLATVSPLLPRLVRDLRGRADARIRLEPGPAGLAWDGTFEVSGGSIHVPTLRQRFEPIEGVASLHGDVLRIDTLRVGQEGQHADVAGRIQLGESFRPTGFDVVLELVQLPLARARPLTTDASGRLTLNGPPEGLRLEGAIELSSVRVRLVDAGDPALREFEVVTSDAERRSRREMLERVRPPDVLERASIDVKVTVPRNSWVRGRGADIDLAGTLRIEKGPGQPIRVSGRVATLRGTYRFQGKRFDLRRGSVVFAGGTDLDPQLDIEAVHRVRDVTIVIQLSGLASEPVVALTSEPPLPEDDVLSYLFFGRPTADLGSKQPTGNLDRAAAAFAAGVALREASRLVEDTMPIDTVDVRIEEDGSSGGVGVGKYLTDDLFVRYERGFGEDAADGVKVELRLSDHWSVETEASTDESAGADLVWSYDY